MITTVIIAIIIALFMYVIYKSIINNTKYKNKKDKKAEYKENEKGFLLESIK